MKQSLSNNAKCKFSFNGMFSECFEYFPSGFSKTQAEDLENATCTIDSLETYTELGNKDFEYYNIKFDLYPNTIFIGFSGYHLTQI